MAQTSYSQTQDQAFLGKLGDVRFKTTESFIAEEAIPVGVAVTKVVGKDDQVQLPDATDNAIIGIAEHTHRLQGGLPGDTTPATYPEKDVVNVLTQGSIWVYFETAFNPDTATLYVRVANAGAGEGIGFFRNDADGGDAVAVTGNFKVATTLTAAGLGLLVINKPN